MSNFSKVNNSIWSYRWAWATTITLALTMFFLHSIDKTVKEDTWIMKYQPKVVWTGEVVGKIRKEETRTFEMKITPDDYRELSSIELKTFHETEIGDTISIVVHKERASAKKWITAPLIISTILVILVFGWFTIPIVMSMLIPALADAAPQVVFTSMSVTIGVVSILILAHRQSKIAVSFFEWKRYSNGMFYAPVMCWVIGDKFRFFTKVYMTDEKYMASKEDALVTALTHNKEVKSINEVLNEEF